MGAQNAPEKCEKMKKLNQKRMDAIMAGFVKICKKFNPSHFVIFDITDLTEDNENWTINVSLLSTSGGIPFSDEEDIIVSFVTNGNRGEKGEKGEKR